VGVLGVFANGTLGYRLLGHLYGPFYYEPNKQVLNLWLSIDGVFLSIYGVGCVLFLAVVLRSTCYAGDAA